MIYNFRGDKVEKMSGRLCGVYSLGLSGVTLVYYLSKYGAAIA